MTDDGVTYEQYLKAKRFSRFRYEWGIFILIGCWVTLVLLIIAIVIYSNELSTNPAAMLLKKTQTDYCYCYSSAGMYYINSTSIGFEELLGSPLVYP